MRIPTALAAILLILLPLHPCLAPAAEPPAAVDYAGVAGATLTDSGAMIVTGGGPLLDREETFEFLRRPDGGHTLLNAITAANGAYRVQARFELDTDWNSQSARGLGLYDGRAVSIAMQRVGKEVRIEVGPTEGGAGPHLANVAACDPTCFINMSPSATSMFVMTRHYDFARGGEQEFLWTGQDLDRARTLSGGSATLRFAGERRIERPGGAILRLRKFSFVESLPTPTGRVAVDFDLWTDLEDHPMGFRLRSLAGKPSAIVAYRQGYEELRSLIDGG